MENFNSKEHWEKIYTTKELKDVSWYQPVPETSLAYLKRFDIPKHAKIIDVGGGDSFLVDHLIKKGFEDVTVLDISKAALERAKKRLGEDASKVNWIESDASTFSPGRQYDFWHDRAAFHFLTDEPAIESYLATMAKGIKPNGLLVLGTFSEQGPKKCSGIEIRQYSAEAMTERLHENFDKIECNNVDHTTPSGGVQNFTFCSFRRKA